MEVATSAVVGGDADMELAARMADAARGIAVRHFRQEFSLAFKQDQSPVTAADRAIEAQLRQILSCERPGDGVLGEEMENIGLGAERVWVLDPIDGTGAFATGSPLFGTLIGLLATGRPTLGVIDAAALGERWSAALGQGARFNGVPCRTSGRTRLETASISSTSVHAYGAEDFSAFRRVSEKAAITRLGGDCYAYGLLAAGHLDAVVETGLQPYDYLPIVPIVTEAGGEMTDWSGAPLTAASSGRVVAAATPELHARIVELLAAVGPE